MPPRSLWTGTISFGLVNVPVRMYSAIEEHTLHFHFIHEQDESRIGYEKICKKEGKPVPDEEIVRAFEFEKDEYVYMTDEDFDAAKVEGFKTIDIRDFVPYDEIDPIYFRKTYYLGPQDGAEKTYALLRDAMAKSGLAAIAKFIMRDRQNLACLRVRDDVITLEQMYFADEVREHKELAPGKVEVPAQELKMAEALIDSYAGAFEPEKYEDTYRDTLCEIIQAKRKGKEVHVDRRVAEEEAPSDLLAALRASVEAAQKGERPIRRSGSNGDSADSDDGLAALSKDELYDRAKKADIPGRAKMSKDELVEALEKAA